jgi:plasmid stabilization system protein ParE
MHVLGGTYAFQYRYDRDRVVILRIFHGREAR